MSRIIIDNGGNSFAGSGASLTGVNAATLGGLGANQFWKTAGNSGTTPAANFIGTTDNQPLELRVNGQRALRLQPNTNAPPNLIAGSSSNSIASSTSGATLAGGDRNFIESFPGAASDFATIGGGSSNHIGYFSFNAVIGGGYQNTLEPNDYYSSIAGGYLNQASGNFSLAAGNRAKANHPGTGVKHLGPVAQDFQAAFGLGTDDTSIGTVDADGVALTAIQGLNKKLREEIDRRAAENAELKRSISELKSLVHALALNRP